MLPFVTCDSWGKIPYLLLILQWFISSNCDFLFLYTTSMVTSYMEPRSASSLLFFGNHFFTCGNSWLMKNDSVPSTDSPTGHFIKSWLPFFYTTLMITCYKEWVVPPVFWKSLFHLWELVTHGEWFHPLNWSCNGSFHPTVTSFFFTRLEWSQVIRNRAL